MKSRIMRHLSFYKRKKDLFSPFFSFVKFSLYHFNSLRHNSTFTGPIINECTYTLPKDTNQAIGLAKYALDFINEKVGKAIPKEVTERVKLFHLDSALCGVSSIALRTNAPTVLREEALSFPQEKGGACVFGSAQKCITEKAVAANCSAVREWDANGTVFGFNAKIKNHQAGEFGHNDFYPVVIAASHVNPTIDGLKALRAMICLDEIRGRLCEVFSLKSYQIDHVLYGAIASAIVYGTLINATVEQIESAIGMIISHYTPWRAIRSGIQLSDSKGASAALSAEAAILSMRRSINGFLGPRDIFRNPAAIFRYFKKTENNQSPFDIILTHSGCDFAVMSMHFKLGLYEHQSASAVEGLIKLLSNHPELYEDESKIKSILIVAYEPAFSIIGDVAKKNPTTRQSADHSMLYIIATLIRKAIEKKNIPKDLHEAWKRLMLDPFDYSKNSINNHVTKKIMNKITFKHGGLEYDRLYPKGIPTKIDIHKDDGQVYSSGLVLFPSGHALNTSNFKDILNHKMKTLGSFAADTDECVQFINKLNNFDNLSCTDMQDVYNLKLKMSEPID